MLKKLSIQNFALIDDLEIVFNQGMTALTGETGAGKSIILESLQLLFGKRSDATMIRYGMPKAHVLGVFELNAELQKSLNLPSTIYVERDIDQSGRHMMKINGEQTTLTRIKDVMMSIGAIHAQTEAMSLFDKSYYLELIDQMDDVTINEYLTRYLVLRSHYLAKKKHHESLKQKKHSAIEKKDYLEFQSNELRSLNLKPDEKLMLEEHIEKLKNFDKIQSSLRSTYQMLDEEGFSLDRIYDAAKFLQKIASIDKDYQLLNERLENTFYELDDIKARIYGLLNDLDFDEDAFNEMQERFFELTKIEQKYHKSVNELIDYLHEIEEELMLITDYDHYIEASEKELSKAFEDAYQAGIKLTNIRKKVAKKLEIDMIKELKDLELDKASFEILFEEQVKDENNLLETGLDHIDFLISLNEGEPIKPLSKVASGGERARFMFALKIIHARAHGLSTLILDEIDIGISGKTAAKVAAKMRALSQETQLIVITHLPHVAAKADYQIGIFKQKEHERMVTRIHVLTEDERIEAVARMLSDEKISSFAIEQAKIFLIK